MKKKMYVQPRVSVYEVESQPILAGSGSEQNAKGSFKVNSDVAYGDDDDVWE